jgi:ubiquinone/menaquinone biosynthesis C-methylase UbiE
MIGDLARQAAASYRASARARRATIFLQHLNPSDNDRILDLGGGDGSHIASIVPFRRNVWVADIQAPLLEKARRRFGFHTALLDESGDLPFSDAYFDIVFCSSVIEHVTVDKRDLRLYRSDRKFRRVALERQQKFANEISRVGKSYFVQTPYKYFPIESHTWLPVVIELLPRASKIAVIDFSNRFWIKWASPDWHLLSVSQVRRLFPNATLLFERSFGFRKSIMAIHPCARLPRMRSVLDVGLERRKPSVAGSPSAGLMAC